MMSQMSHTRTLGIRDSVLHCCYSPATLVSCASRKVEA